MFQLIMKKIPNQVLSRFVWRNHFFSADITGNGVAFTFDDGPAPQSTTRLVDLFAQYNGKASFFFRGDHAEKWPDIVKYTHQAGCSVGNHSYNHPHFDKIGTCEMVRQIKKTNEILQNITGEYPIFLRPPGHRITQWETLVVKLRFRQFIMACNIAPMDWVISRAEDLAQFITSHAVSGAIICLHDFSERTITALEMALPQLKARGFSFLSLEEMLNQGSFSPYRKIHLFNLKG